MTIEFRVGGKGKFKKFKTKADEKMALKRFKELGKKKNPLKDKKAQKDIKKLI